jgi:parvulin-like peptidyl-prolyl isomerase
MTRTDILRRVCGVLALLLLLACGGPEARAARAPESGVLLRVGPLTAGIEDLREAGEAIHGAPMAQLSLEQLRLAADALIAARLIVLEAERRGLHEDPAVVAALDSVRSAWLREAIYERDVFGTIGEPTSADISALYQEWGAGEQVEGFHILLRSREEAERVLQRLEAGESFGELARTLSVHSMSSGVGGLMGWLRRGQYPPPIADAIWDLAPGTWADEPVRTGMGWHVVMARDRRTLSLERQRDALVGEWRRRQRVTAREAFLEDLRQRYEVTYHPETTAAVASLQDTISGERSIFSWKGGQLDLVGFLARVQVPDPVSQDTARMHRLAHDVAFDELAALEASARGFGQLPDFQKRLRDKRFQLLGQRLYEDVNALPPEPSEVRAFFDEHRDAFRSHTVVTVREILVDEQTTADSLYQLLLDGAEMAELASRHTVRTDLARTAGLWEDVRPGDPRGARIYQAATARGPGLHPPLKIPGGWSVFDVLDIRPGRRLSFDEAREGALRSLEGDRMERLISRLRQEWAPRIELDEARLADLAAD